jgi:hypothetical protein
MIALRLVVAFLVACAASPLRTTPSAPTAAATPAPRWPAEGVCVGPLPDQPDPKLCTMLQESDALAIQQAVLDYFTAEVLAEHPEWVEVRRLAEPPLTDHLIGRYGVWVVRAGADSDLRLSARTTDRNRHVDRVIAVTVRRGETGWTVVGVDAHDAPPLLPKIPGAA